MLTLLNQILTQVEDIILIFYISRYKSNIYRISLWWRMLAYIVFATQEQLGILAESKTWHIDGMGRFIYVLNSCVSGRRNRRDETSAGYIRLDV